MATNYTFQHNEIAGYFILIDSCSLLCPGAAPFWNTRIKWYEQHPSEANKIKIPMACIEETQKRKNKPDLTDREKKEINRMYNSLAKAQKVDAYVGIKDAKDNIFADHTIFFHIAELLMNNNILVITQDKKLTKSLYNITNKSIIPAIDYRKKLVVCRLENDGALSEAFYEYGESAPLTYRKIQGNWANSLNSKKKKKAQPAQQAGNAKPNNTQAQKVNKEEKTNQASKTSAKQNNNNPQQKKKTPNYPKKIKWAKSFLQTGNQVILYSNKKKLTLGKSLGRGKEGEVFLISQLPDKTAKIYLPTNHDSVIAQTYKKLVALISKGLTFTGICFPEDIIVNEKGEFLGYLMPKASGKNLAISAVGNNNKNYDRRNLINWCQKIAKKIEYLHKNNIIIGDLNPNNILLDLNNESIFFVDVDSYQFDDYLCPVFTPRFLAPYLSKDIISKQKRSDLDDDYALAVLIFYILMQGQYPYVQSGLDDVDDYDMTQKKGLFPYALGENTQKNAPPGQSRYIWSFLTRDIKSKFWNTFNHEGVIFQNLTYLTPTQWIEKLNRYSRAISQRGSLYKLDPMSIDIHPKRLKFSEHEEYGEPCPICGQRFPRKHYIKGFCHQCARKKQLKGYPKRCKQCGKKINYTYYDAYGDVRKPRPKDLCDTCLKLKR